MFIKKFAREKKGQAWTERDVKAVLRVLREADSYIQSIRMDLLTVQNALEKIEEASLARNVKDILWDVKQVSKAVKDVLRT